jgi:hypothetical protein
LLLSSLSSGGATHASKGSAQRAWSSSADAATAERAPGTRTSANTTAAECAAEIPSTTPDAAATCRWPSRIRVCSTTAKTGGSAGGSAGGSTGGSTGGSKTQTSSCPGNSSHAGRIGAAWHGGSLPSLPAGCSTSQGSTAGVISKSIHIARLLRGHRNRHQCERARHRTVCINVDQTKVFTGDRILVLTTDKAESVAGNQVLDTGRIDTIFVLILPDRTNVFLAAKDKLRFSFAPALHDPKRNDDRRENGGTSDEANQCSKRKAFVTP